MIGITNAGEAEGLRYDWNTDTGILGTKHPQSKRCEI
jgi:hypothetical protein